MSRVASRAALSDSVSRRLTAYWHRLGVSASNALSSLALTLAMLLAAAPAAGAQDKPLPPPAAAPSVVPSPTPESVAEPRRDSGEKNEKDADRDGQRTQQKSDKPEKADKIIALIAPIASKSLGKVGEVLRAGFTVAAEAGAKDGYVARVYFAEDEGASLASLYRKARGDGAVAIIGGITRDGAAAMARESGALPTLLLNAFDGTSPPNDLYQISLSAEADARQLARAISDEGLRAAAVVHTPSPLAKRIQDAFEKEWQRLGGSVVARIPFSGLPEDGPRVRAAMEKTEAAKADVAFIAADAPAARAARPFLPQGLPVYATAYTLDWRAGAVENLDLDSVRFLEMPWFAEPDHAGVMAYPKSSEALAIDYERLYALGIDAWRIVMALLAVPPARDGLRKLAPIDGVTGRLTLDGHQFLRALTLVEMRDGRPQRIRP